MKFTRLTLLVVFSIYFIFPLHAQFTPDPGIGGSLTVAKDTYNFGDLYFQSSSITNKIEFRGNVHYPATLSGNQYPVILLLHGRHNTCYNPTTNGTVFQWPCTVGNISIPSFEGYNYFANNMASLGFIVISISSNSINFNESGTLSGMIARAELIHRHLKFWDSVNTMSMSPFGTKFINKLNMQNIGTMGHSRGGEGVIFHAKYNDTAAKKFGLKAVLTLAPVDFNHKVKNRVALMNIAPYCDGDVNDLQGVHFYDDCRYNDTGDLAAKYNILMFGANHNFYNTIWTPATFTAGASDDAMFTYSSSDTQCGSSSSKRLTPIKQQAAFNAYAAAFFRLHLKDEIQFAPLLEVSSISPPISAQSDSNKLFVSYHPPKNKRLDIHRTDQNNSTTSNTMTGTVSQTGLLNFSTCGGGLALPSCSTTLGGKEPHHGSASFSGLNRLGMRWDNLSDQVSNIIPTNNSNFLKYKYIQFRVGSKVAEITLGKVQNFSIELIDSNNISYAQPVNKYTTALYYPPGFNTSQLPRIMFNTVKLPLDSFKNINKNKIKKVNFLFNIKDSGSIYVSDLSLSGYIENVCDLINSNFNSDTASLTCNFSDNIPLSNEDTISRLWKFGNTRATIGSDTSSAATPSYSYDTSGVYTVCLYRTVKTIGKTCSDSVCKKIVVFKPLCGNITTKFGWDTNQLQVKLYDSSIVFPNGNIKYSWKFGNPRAIVGSDTSSSKNPIYNYDTSGTYIVKLIISVDRGGGLICKDSFTQTIQIYKPFCGYVKAKFGVDTTQLLASFHDSSTITPIDTIRYFWKFGNPRAIAGSDTSTAKNPTYLYDTTGNYIVKLIVKVHRTNGLICVDSTTKNIYVYKPFCGYVKANFGFDTTFLRVKFKDSSIVTPADTIRYFWVFGNTRAAIGTDTSTAKNPIYFYDTTGYYTARLVTRVHRKNGLICSDTFYRQVYVYKPFCGYVHSNFGTSISSLQIQCSDSSIAIPAEPIKYFWKFGNTKAILGSDTTSIQNPIYTYDSSGNYSIQLIAVVYRANGLICKDTMIKNIYVYKPFCGYVKANFAFDTSHYVATMHDSTKVIPFEPAVHHWIFGNYRINDHSDTSSLSSPIYTYDTSGTYQIKHIATVYRSNGLICADTQIRNIVIYKPVCGYIKAKYGYDTTLLQVRFYDSSIVIPYENPKWRWKFNDTSFTNNLDTSISKNPMFYYLKSGTYNVCLKITVKRANGLTCIDTLCKDVTALYPTCGIFQPKFNFSQSKNTLFYSDNSIHNPGDSITRLWNFGDTSLKNRIDTSTALKPTYTFRKKGVYKTCLIERSYIRLYNLNCIDTICNQISVANDLIGVNIQTAFNEKVVIYPNPAKDELYIDNFEMIHKIEFYTLEGKNIYQINKLEKGYIKLPDFMSKGVYFLHLYSENEMQSVKLIVE